MWESLHKVTLSGVWGFYTSSRLDEGLNGPEPPKLKTTMEKSVQVTTSARLSDEGQWSLVPAAGELGHGEQAARGGGTRTRSATLCTHLQARKGPGQREGVEKGAGATWKVLYRGDGEEKGTRTMPPNHADKTQPVQHRTAGPAGGSGSWDNST